MAKAETLNSRVARLENAMAQLAEKHTDLHEMVKILMDAQIKTEEKFRQTDERIDKLVSAIGEFIRRNGK